MSKRKSYIVLLNTSEGKLVFYPYAYNKYLLPIIGLGLLRIQGLFAGLLIGLVLDCKFIPKESKKRSPDLRIAYLMCGVYILQRSSGFNRLPVQEIIRRFELFLGSDFIRSRIRFIEQLSKQRIQIEAACRQIRAESDLLQKQWLVRSLEQLVNHPLCNQAQGRAAINQVMGWIGIRPKAGYKYNRSDKNSRPYTPPSVSKEDKWLAILGLKRNVDAETAKKTYYKLAKQHHPDINNHSKESEARFRDIKEAYEGLKEIRGWK